MSTVCSTTPLFLRIDLPSLLPPYQYLVLCTKEYHGRYSLTLREGAQDLAQCFLSDCEVLCFNALRANYPAYTPHESLLAALKDRPIEEVRQEYHARLSKRYTPYMQGLRTHVCNLRAKLFPFGIDIMALHLQGYELRKLPLGYPVTTK